MEIPQLYPREPDSHKNDYGRVFVLAGSNGMVGAAVLCSLAALRAGCGYVKLGLPWRLAALAGSNANMMCIVTAALPETEDGSLSLLGKPKVLDACKDFDVLAIGPGLSMNAQTQQMLIQLLPELTQALVLDADALNAVAKQPAVIADLPREKGLPVFTPHPGEFARLTGMQAPPREPVLREQACRDYAAKHNIVCVLKGYRTVVSDGKRVYVNATGNPGMATAGTGDVLTGCIAALRGQGYDSFEAAVLGVYLHGLAGDIAAETFEHWGMTAVDVLNALPTAFLRHYRYQVREAEARKTAVIKAATQSAQAANIQPQADVAAKAAREAREAKDVKEAKARAKKEAVKEPAKESKESGKEPAVKGS